MKVHLNQLCSQSHQKSNHCCVIQPLCLYWRSSRRRNDGMCYTFLYPCWPYTHIVIADLCPSNSYAFQESLEDCQTSQVQEFCRSLDSKPIPCLLRTLAPSTHRRYNDYVQCCICRDLSSLHRWQVIHSNPVDAKRHDTLWDHRLIHQSASEMARHSQRFLWCINLFPW